MYLSVLCISLDVFESLATKQSPSPSVHILDYLKSKFSGSFAAGLICSMIMPSECQNVKIWEAVSASSEKKINKIYF